MFVGTLTIDLTSIYFLFIFFKYMEKVVKVYKAANWLQESKRMNKRLVD